MPSHRLYAFLILMSLAVLVVPTSTTLRDLIDNAQPGATILLQPIIYSGPANCDLVINKSLSLVSTAGQAELDCLGQSRCMRVTGGASVTVVGLTLRNGNAMGGSGVKVRAAGQERCDVRLVQSVIYLTHNIFRCCRLGEDRYIGGGELRLWMCTWTRRGRSLGRPG